MEGPTKDDTKRKITVKQQPSHRTCPDCQKYGQFDEPLKMCSVSLHGPDSIEMCGRAAEFVWGGGALLTRAIVIGFSSLCARLSE